MGQETYTQPTLSKLFQYTKTKENPIMKTDEIMYILRNYEVEDEIQNKIINMLYDVIDLEPSPNVFDELENQNKETQS